MKLVVEETRLAVSLPSLLMSTLLPLTTSLDREALLVIGSWLLDKNLHQPIHAHHRGLIIREQFSDGHPRRCSIVLG